MKLDVNEVINDENIKHLIMHLANKFYGVEKKDLYQVGYLTITRIIDNFDINSGIKFSTYAYKHIFGAMREYAINSRKIKLSRDYLKMYKRIEDARNILTQKFNRTPSLEEISLFLEVDLNLINEVIITCSNEVLSLDEENSYLENNLYNFIGKEVDYDTKILIDDSLETLDELERKIIDYRYFKDLTQDEVARILGLSQVKVSRLESSSKKKIKKYISA